MPRTWVRLLASVKFFYLFRCVHSSVQPLRSVRRSNFDKGRHNLTILIQKSAYINESCYIIYIYVYFFYHSCPLLIPLCNIATLFQSLFYVVFESTLLIYANPCRNWTFQRFARVAEKKERNGTNEKYDTR